MKEAIRRAFITGSKSRKELVNQKSHRILQKAVWYAPTVSKETIERELGMEKMNLDVFTKKGVLSKAKKHMKAYFFGENIDDVPLLALIIQSRHRKPSPWKGVDRAEGARRMLEAMRRVYGARQKSRAYFKACFATARDVFKNALKKLPMSDPASRGSMTQGSMARDRGRIADATPATERNPAIAKFWIVSPRHDRNDALGKHAAPALQRVYDEAAESTWRHSIEKEYKEACRLAGIRTG